MERKIMAVALSSTLALSTLIACTSAKSDSSSGSQAGSIVPSFDYICSDAACFERVCEADYGYFDYMGGKKKGAKDGVSPNNTGNQCIDSTRRFSKG